MKTDRLAMACGMAVLFAATLEQTTRAQGTTILASSDSNGMQPAFGSNGSDNPAISDDGRYVAFRCADDSFLPGDTNNAFDVCRKDLVTNAVILISVTPLGVTGDDYSGNPKLSADGRYVAFESWASNLLTTPDSNGTSDIFLRDVSVGITVRVSVSTSGAEADGESDSPSISADGRFVAFESAAGNLVAGDTNQSFDVFVRDTQLHQTELVSISTSGAQTGIYSFGPSVSADGRFVAFSSVGDLLDGGDTNGGVDVYVRDRQNGVTQRVSVGAGGIQGDNESEFASISGDGRWVSFWTNATNLVPGDGNNTPDMMVFDRSNGVLRRISSTSSGTAGNSESWRGAISRNGRLVVYQSLASDLVPNDTNASSDIFAFDLVTGVTTRVSVSSSGAQGADYSEESAVDADGRFIAFNSRAPNLVAGDMNAWTPDIFVHDLRPPLPNVYCTSGTTSHGCSASIGANACPSVSFGTACNITVTGVEGQQSGILFYGIDNSGFTPRLWVAGSTSLLCVKQPTQRTPIQNSGGTLDACSGAYVLDWNAYQTAHPFALGNPWSIGDKVYVQAWFRDPGAVKSTNLSNALEMTYVP
jgi:Tol biopolymer transport system component